MRKAGLRTWYTLRISNKSQETANLYDFGTQGIEDIQWYGPHQIELAPESTESMPIYARSRPLFHGYSHERSHLLKLLRTVTSEFLAG